MKKVLLVLAILFSASLVFAGGSQEEAADDGSDEITITMSTWLINEGASEGVVFDMVRMFEEQNPGINVEVTGVPYAQTLQQATVTMAGGNPPDVLHLTPMFSAPLVAMDGLTDLEPYFDDSELDEIPAAAYDAGVIDGELISVPWQLGPVLVLAWKDLLNEAGYDAIPETWDEFEQAVADISALGDNVYGFGARTDKTANSAFWFFPVMEGMGGSFVNDQGEVTFNTPGTRDALSWYKTLGTEEMTPYGMGVKEVRNLFARGQVGFIFDGPWMKGILRTISGEGEAVDDKYLVGELPIGRDGERHTIANNHVLSVAERSEHKDAAAQLVRFLTTDPEATELYYREMGAIPASTALLEQPLYDTSYGNVVRRTAEYANALPSDHPKLNAALEHVATAMQSALLGEDVEAAAREAERRIQDTLE